MNSKSLLLDRSEQNIRIKQTSGARHALTIPALGKPRQQDCEFKASLTYIVITFLKRKARKKRNA